MKLKEYIEENKENLYKVECFVNTKDIPDIRDENTREFFFANDGFTESYADDIKLSKTLLESEPLKVYLMNKESYDSIMLNNFGGTTYPKDKNILVALYSNDIIVPEKIE